MSRKGIFKRSLLEADPELAKEFDIEKNGITPDNVSCSELTVKRHWVCSKCKHTWQTTVDKRYNRRHGCKMCHLSAPFKIALQDGNLELAKEFDVVRNEITPDKISFSEQLIKRHWICSKCGYPTIKKGGSVEYVSTWQTTVRHRSYRGQGCPCCANQVCIAGINDLSTTNPILAKQWHPIKNKDLTPEMVVEGSTHRAWWLCPDCDYSYNTVIHSRTASNTGCPCCANQVCVPHVNSLAVKNKALAKEWHPTRNGDLTPDRVLPNTTIKAWWLCPDCGNNYQATCHLRNSKGTGCPKCARKKSFPELAIFFYIQRVFPQAINCYKLNNGMEVDIYIPEHKLAIEYDGVNWHQLKYHSDAHKNYLLSEHLFVRVREDGLEAILDYGCYNIFVKSGNIPDLEIAIKRIFEIIQNNGINIPNIPDINIIRDNITIRGLLYQKIVENSLATKHPYLISEWDNEKNGSITPYNVSYGSGELVWWRCKDWGHSFKARISERIREEGKSSNCPYCSNNKVLLGFNDLVTSEPLIAREWFSCSKVNSPSELVYGSVTQVTWKCSDCGDLLHCGVMERTTSTRAADCSKCKRKFSLLGKLILDGEIKGLRFQYGKRFCDVGLDLLSVNGFKLHLNKAVQGLPIMLFNNLYMTEIEFVRHLHVKEVTNIEDRFFSRLRTYLKLHNYKIPTRSMEEVLECKETDIVFSSIFTIN